MTIRLINEFYQNQDEVNRTYYGSFAGITYTSYPENGIIWKYSGLGVADREAVRTILDANYIIYRMADVMLMKAEALIRIGGWKCCWTSGIWNLLQKENAGTICYDMASNRTSNIKVASKYL